MRIASLLLAAVLISGCNVTGPKEWPVIFPTPPEYSTAPETLSVNGMPVVLRASLYRDFMPVSPPDGLPLSVAAVIAGVDPNTMTSRFEFLSLAVVRGPRAWITRFERSPSIPEVIAVRATGGPKWGPNERVDVVARVRLPNGEVKLIAARGVMIRMSS